VELGPEPAGVLLRFPFAREADGLAGEAAGDEIDGLRGLDEGPDIAISRNVWPVACKHLDAPRVVLDLPGDSHPGSFEAKINAADAAKERANRQHP
jgi:hypothetical protein